MRTKLTTMTPRIKGTALSSRRAMYLPSPPASPPELPAPPLIASFADQSGHQEAGRVVDRDPPVASLLLSEPEELETVALVEKRPHAPQVRGSGLGGEFVEHDHGGHVLRQDREHLIVDGRTCVEVGEAGRVGQQRVDLGVAVAGGVDEGGAGCGAQVDAVI